MQTEVINSAVYHCIAHSNGHLDAAEAFIACLRADDAWSDAGIDMVERIALPIVNEPIVFQLFALPPHLAMAP